jgi:hypothetical protein
LHIIFYFSEIFSRSSGSLLGCCWEWSNVGFLFRTLSFSFLLDFGGLSGQGMVCKGTSRFFGEVLASIMEFSLGLASHASTSLDLASWGSTSLGLAPLRSHLAWSRPSRSLFA